jgi:hypothetical protein
MVQRAIPVGSYRSLRPRLLRDVHPSFVWLMAYSPAPAHQLRLDLEALNRARRLADRSIPLVTYLRNAVEALPDEADALRRLADSIGPELAR